MLGLNNKKKNLLAVWHETEHVLKTDILCRQSIEDSRERTIFYPETDVIYPNMKEKTGNKVPKNVTVSEWDTFTAASKLSYKYDEKIAVLNFANAYHPGGGVTIGARAQEEDLCRVSTLYPVLATKENVERYYGRHSKNFTAYGTSDILYSPDIFVFRFSDDEYTFRTPDEFLNVDVITCAAPQFKKPLEGGVLDNTEKKQRLYQAHLERGKRIIESAVANNAKILVLGAFGCGAFNNDPYIVSEAYRTLMISYAHYFDVVEFAIYCTDKEKRNYRIFKEVLSR